MLDLTGDTTESAMRRTHHRAKMVWDKKKKRMVGVNTNSKEGKIKPESEKWIPATYRSGRYKAWMERNNAGDDDSASDEETDKKRLVTTLNTHWGRQNMKMQQKARLNLKNTDQILKQRMIAEKKKKKNARKTKRKKKN